MKKIVCAVAVISLLLLVGPLMAGSPAGYWKTVDDETKKAKSIVRIYEVDGKLYGKVTEILTPGEEDKICEKCPGEDKDKPIKGLIILRELLADNGGYSGGTILDPNNGKTYSCKMALEDEGRKLKVRGFLGFSLLGRTQYWERVQ
jgi:uncharacterized protein (DUF2147 family)